MKKVYLASPFFTGYERKRVRKVAEHFRNQGYEVYVPMEHFIEDAWEMSNQLWGLKVFREDIKAIQESDLIVAILNNGMTDDAGTCWEMGYAFGLKKYIIAIVDNRLQSLMTMNGVNEVWSIDDLKPCDYIEVK